MEETFDHRKPSPSSGSALVLTSASQNYTYRIMDPKKGFYLTFIIACVSKLRFYKSSFASKAKR